MASEPITEWKVRDLEGLDDLLTNLERRVQDFKQVVGLPAVILNAMALPIGSALKLTEEDLDRTLRAIRDQRGDVLIELRKRSEASA